MRKFLKRLLGTNFCTSSALFAPSFVTQPNGRNAPKLYEMHQNISLGSNRIYLVRSFRKISMQIRGMKCTKIVRNAPKHEFRVQWGGTGAFVAKKSDAASWHELLHQFGLFCIEFCKSTKWSQMHQNFMKCTKTFLGSNGGIGCVHCEKFRRDFVARTFAPLRPFCTDFCNSTKWSPMHQNCTKRTEK